MSGQFFGVVASRMKRRGAVAVGTLSPMRVTLRPPAAGSDSIRGSPPPIQIHGEAPDLMASGVQGAEADALVRELRPRNGR